MGGRKPARCCASHCTANHVTECIQTRSGKFYCTLTICGIDRPCVVQRVTGADINPHLALAAVLKCGLWGIKTKQSLPVPPLDQVKASSNEQQGERLARTLQEAIEVMEKQGSIARQALGDAFVDHFVKTRKHEWNLWQDAVTDYELKRYMELV